jgi:hypothetical protein
MRLWSLHPRYLDPRGLTALWREALLAQKVLRGETRGYRSHPQLERFKQQLDPHGAVSVYLQAVLEEAQQRGYHFDSGKIDPGGQAAPIPVTSGQVSYEWEHLKNKLSRRDPARLERFAEVAAPDLHPLFYTVPGPVASWERYSIV